MIRLSADVSGVETVDCAGTAGLVPEGTRMLAKVGSLFYVPTVILLLRYAFFRRALLRLLPK